MTRIAVNLAKSIYQVTESVRSDQMIQRKRLNREAFKLYTQAQAEPVEWVMETCSTVHTRESPYTNCYALLLANNYLLYFTLGIGR